MAAKTTAVVAARRKVLIVVARVHPALIVADADVVNKEQGGA